MMQNLTLPTSQTLALGNTLNSMDAIKNSANSNQSNVEPNSSFEMMLKKQVNANKAFTQDQNEQQNIVQKNKNLGTSVSQKKSNVKVEQNEQSDSEKIKIKQSEDATLDNNISMTQLLDDAKALFGDKKTEELANEASLLNITNQDTSQQASAIAIAPNLAIPTNNANQSQSKDIDLNDSGLDKTLLKSSNNQINSAMLPQVVGEDKSDLLDAKQRMDLDGKDLPQDRLIWASVSTSKSSLNQSQSDEIVNKSMVDSTKLLDTVNSLSMSTPTQTQPAQSNSILPMHQLGSSNQINAYPGKTGWDQAISQKIVWMVGAAEQTATLSLNPPDLGPLQVVINVSNNMADTTFISNNAEVRQALQDGMANLREKMAESGIQLGQANVNSGGRPQQEFSSAFFNSPPSNSQTSRLSEIDASSSLPSTSQTTRLVQVSNGLVDTFV